MLARVGSKGKTHAQLGRMQACTAAVEITVAVRQENRNQSSSQSSCIILGNIPKGSYIFSSVVCIAVLSHNSGGKQLRCSSRGKWIQKICHIDTMECYLIFKNSKFSGKWLKLGKNQIHKIRDKKWSITTDTRETQKTMRTCTPVL